MNYQSLELLYLLVLKELKVRYKNSFLGYVWAILNPLAFSIIYYFAFKIVMRIDIPNYSIYLLTGMFPWLWFSNAIVTGTSIYRSDVSIIKSTQINRKILPLSAIFHEMAHFIFALPVLVILLVVTQQPLYVSWLWQLPILIGVQVALLFPVVLFLSTLNIIVKDVEYMIGILMTMMFFLTPIVYPMDLVPERFQFLYNLSPLVLLVESWHDLFLEGVLNLVNIYKILMVSALLYLPVHFFYRKYIIKAGEYL